MRPRFSVESKVTPPHSDLKELTLELTGQNKELGETYEDLIHQKSFIYHQNEKKK